MSPKPLPATVSVTEPEPDLSLLRLDVDKELGPIQQEVEKLNVQSVEDYEAADGLLFKITQKRTWWSTRFIRIYAKAKGMVDDLQALNRDVDGPWKRLEEAVKAGMKDYKLRELEASRQEQRRRDLETERLRKEADDKAKRADAAKTPQMKAKLEKEALNSEVQAHEIQRARPSFMPVKGAGSSAREQEKVKVDGENNLLLFLQGVLEGEIPLALIAVNQPQLNQQFKDTPDAVKKYPGVTVYTDVTIARR